MHDGTVRDCCFLEEGGTGAPLLISGGAGDCKVGQLSYILFCLLPLATIDVVFIIDRVQYIRLPIRTMVSFSDCSATIK
jgi:hypothetical protein